MNPSLAKIKKKLDKTLFKNLSNGHITYSYNGIKSNKENATRVLENMFEVMDFVDFIRINIEMDWPSE